MAGGPVKAPASEGTVPAMVERCSRRALMRVCNVHSVPIATNVGAADLFLSSPLLHTAEGAPTA